MIARALDLRTANSRLHTVFSTNISKWFCSDNYSREATQGKPVLRMPLSKVTMPVNSALGACGGVPILKVNPPSCAPNGKSTARLKILDIAIIISKRNG